MVRQGERFVSLDDLNEAATERILACAKRPINPVTGDKVYDTWPAECEILQALLCHCRHRLTCRCRAGWAVIAS